MLKALLIVLLIALPTIAYLAYLRLVSRRDEAGFAGRMARVPWHWLSLVGVGIVAASLTAWALSGERAAPTDEVPPLEDEVVVPETHTPPAD